MKVYKQWTAVPLWSIRPVDDDDWVVMRDSFPEWRYLLCEGETTKWWDLKGVEDIQVTISDTPSASGYRCKVEGDGRIHIQNERNNVWHDYAPYSLMEDEIRALFREGVDTYYLSIEEIL